MIHTSQETCPRLAAITTLSREIRDDLIDALSLRETKLDGIEKGIE